MLEATKGVDSGGGVLHIAKNYTGDVMNFEMAAELAAAETGHRSRASSSMTTSPSRDSLYTAGRRGVGVTVLLEKLGRQRPRKGDRSPSWGRCPSCKRVGRSMGMALTSCTVPAAGKPTFQLGEDEMELGIGIHGEPGRRRVPLAECSMRSPSN